MLLFRLPCAGTHTETLAITNLESTFTQLSVAFDQVQLDMTKNQPLWVWDLCSTRGQRALGWIEGVTPCDWDLASCLGLLNERVEEFQEGMQREEGMFLGFLQDKMLGVWWALPTGPSISSLMLGAWWALPRGPSNDYRWANRNRLQ